MFPGTSFLPIPWAPTPTNPASWSGRSWGPGDQAGRRLAEQGTFPDNWEGDQGLAAPRPDPEQHPTTRPIRHDSRWITFGPTSRVIRTDRSRKGEDPAVS